MRERNIEIFLGPGGVGKTTLSAAYAEFYSQKYRDKKIKLITIDPSKRVRDYFKMREDDEETHVKSNLTVSLNQREGVFKRFIEESIEDRELKNMFYQSRMFSVLIDDLSVSQDFTSLYEIWSSYREKTYDKIILDTPPFQNSADFLQGSKKLQSLFSSSVMKIFIPSEKRGIFSILEKGQRLALNKLKILTGSDFIAELEVFFLLMNKIKTKIEDVINQSEKIIKEESSLALVCNYNELSLKSLKVSLRLLLESGLYIKRGYINKFMKDVGGNIIRNFEDLEDEHIGINFSKIQKVHSKNISLKDFLKEFEK